MWKGKGSRGRIMDCGWLAYDGARTPDGMDGLEGTLRQNTFNAAVRTVRPEWEDEEEA